MSGFKKRSNKRRKSGECADGNQLFSTRRFFEEMQPTAEKCQCNSSDENKKNWDSNNGVPSLGFLKAVHNI